MRHWKRPKGLYFYQKEDAITSEEQNRMILSFCFFMKPSAVQPDILTFSLLLRSLTSQIFGGPPDPRAFALMAFSWGTLFSQYPHNATPHFNLVSVQMLISKLLMTNELI